MTDPNWILAPGGRWTARDKVGNAAVGAFVYTFVNQTRTPKSTAQDPGGVTLNTNPFQLDSAGEAQVYWETDEYYSIEIWSIDPNNPTVPYELIYTEDNYPVTGAGSGGDITIVQSFPNLVRNSQFTYWFYDYSPLTTNPASTYTTLGTISANIAQDWNFSRSNTNATVSISRQLFSYGQTDVPGSPVYYLNHQTTSVGSGGETYKYLWQAYWSAQTLANVQISVGIWARSMSSSPITINLTQNFGTGGSPTPPVVTTVLTAALTPTWTFYTGTVTLPTTLGSVQGTNQNDSLQLSIQYPINTVCNIDTTNVVMVAAPTLPSQFPYITIDDQRHRLNTQVPQATFVTGDVKYSINPVAQLGWISCNDGTIGNAFSGANYTGQYLVSLFTLLWAISATYVPIYNSDGSAGTRGANALADFNANKRIQLTRSLGRLLGAAGTSGDSGVSPRNIGQYAGTTTRVIGVTNLPPHGHEGYYQDVTQPPATINTLNPISIANPRISSSTATGSGSTIGLNSTPLDTTPPSIYLYAYIKF